MLNTQASLLKFGGGLHMAKINVEIDQNYQIYFNICKIKTAKLKCGLLLSN